MTTQSLAYTPGRKNSLTGPSSGARAAWWGAAPSSPLRLACASCGKGAMLSMPRWPQPLPLACSSRQRTTLW